MNRHWHERQDEDGILWLGLEYADGPVNVLSKAVIEELDKLLAGIARDPPAAVLIHSLKESGFIAGADVRELAAVPDAATAGEHIRWVHGVMDRLEALPCPTLAMIHGFCLGGGLELALACRYRVASDAEGTRIGFPEVKLGIFPGYGGTFRAIRTLGAPAAMEILLTGRLLRPSQARRLGLVDVTAPRRQLEAAARDILAREPHPRRATAVQRLASLPPVRAGVASQFTRRTRARVRPEHYPAPFALIEHWRRHGAKRAGLLTGEAETVPGLLMGDTARNLIRVFGLEERLKSLGRDAGSPPRRVHLVGAGTMGADIAAWCALRGLDVSLQDRSADQIGRALKRARALFDKRAGDPRAARAAWDRLMPDPRGDGIAGADLLIEAIVEDADAKRTLFADLERRARPDAVLATNTSSIPLETLAERLMDPGRLVGVHFFNPVERMRLVEVVRGEDTGKAAMARAIAFVRAIDRLPLPVKSSPGFLVNRVLMPYLLEAVDLLEEGVPATAIDQAAMDYGMPMGPIALADAVGLDICLAVARKLGSRLAAPEETPPRLVRMVEAGRLGKKSGTGFYQYRGGKAVPEPLPRDWRPPPDLAERMVFRLLNECVACLADGVVADADLLDAGVIFGTGFAPFRGGPMHSIEQGGWRRMLARLESLERRHGGHFRPDGGWNRPLQA